MNNRTLLIIMLLALGAPWAARAQETLPYEYGFENNDLTGEGWTKNGSTNSKPYEYAKRTGSYGFRFYCTSLYPEQYLVSPELTTNEVGTMVEFYYKAPSTAQTFQVGYSTTSSNVISDFTYGDPITTSDNNWNVFSQTFSSETKYIAIKYTTTSSYTYLYLDDFVFEQYSDYPTPKNLVVTTYTSNSATLDWTPRTGQDHWDIYYTTSSTAPDASTAPSVANTETRPYTITGLESGVTYHACVRGNYNNGEHYSDWSNACDFEVGCYTPNIGQAQASCNMAYFTWTPVGSETSWQVAFSDQQGFNPEEVTLETVTTQYYNKEGLVTGVTYYARVRAVCGEGDYSDWSEEVSMTTQCFAPSNLQESSVTPTTATLTWNMGSSETQWQISYSTTENFTPDNGTIVTVDNKPYTLGGLTVNTAYYACVRAVCGENIYSDWSEVCTFTPRYELTVGDGTNTNSSIPFYSYFVDYTTKSQFIIPAADLADLLYANIDKLTFYANTQNANFGNATFDVLISELDGVTSFETAAFFDWSSMSTVYSGSVSVSGGKMEINLNAPYQYMGGDLLIGFNQLSTGSGVSAYWYGVSTSDYNSYGGFEMSGYSSFDRYRFLPKVSFSYTLGTAPTCLKPKNLAASDVGTSSATLSWTPGGDETAWQYVISTDPNFNPDNYNPLTVQSNPFTLSGLTPETTYYAYVRANCGESDVSAWSNRCSFMPSAMRTITLNDGTSTSYNTPFYYSANSYNVKNQFIVPASDLSEMLYGQITKLTFYATYNTGSWPDGVFKVYAAPTDLTAFATATPVDWSSLTEVYCGSLTVNGGQMEVTFSTPYPNTGGNLLIGFNETEKSSSYSFMQWYGITTDNYATYYWAGSNYHEKFLPKMTIDYIAGEAPTCAMPSDLRFSRTSTTATVTWTPGGEETAWKFQYKAVADADWSEVVTVENTPTYALDNLTAATDYQVRVKADCGGDNTSYWLSNGFTTRCAPMSLPFEYDFDSDAAGSGTSLPECWTRVNQDAPTTTYAGHPRIMSSSANSHSTTNYLEFYRTTSSNGPLYQMAVLPEMDAPISSLVLSFWGKAGATGSNTLAVGVMTDPDDPTTFEMVKNVALPTTYTQLTVNFEDYTGSGRYIAFSCDRGSYSRTLYVDDISIVVDLSCKAPKNLEISDLTQTTAMLTWTAVNDITEWELQYRMTESSEWSDAVAVSTNPVYTLNGLTAATEYEARVRTICGTDNYSDWATISFTTECDFLTLPFSYGFEDATVGHNAPACWHFSDGTYPKISTGAANSGTKSLYMNKNSNASFAVLPMIDATAYPINTLQMSFYGKRTTYYVSMPYLYVGVMTDPDDATTFQQVDFVSMPNNFSKFEVSFENYTGEGQYIVFRCDQSYGYYIDDILVEVAPTCKTPYQLSINDVEPHEANLMWRVRDEAQMNFQIAYSTTANFNVANATIVDIDASEGSTSGDYRSGSLTGLEASTNYYFRVRANCGEGDFSAWSDDYGQFTTMEACPVPSVYVYTEGSHSVTFSVMEYEYGDLELRYKKASDDEWSEWSEVVYSGTNETSNLFVLDNLEENTEYEVEIRANCGEEGYSTGAFPLSFTTLTGCGSTPRTWMCTTHLGTKATVEWFPENDATRWQIRYRIEGQEYAAENMVLTDEITSSPYRWMLTGLETSTVYYWQVRSYCDENTQSDWSEEAWFTTRCSDGFITVDKAHPFFEDFEGADMPDCWDPVNHYDYSMSHLDDWSHITGTNYSWETYNASKCISSDRNHFHFNSNGAAVLAPALHIDENATSATLSFWSKCDFESSDARGTMHIFVSDNINADDGYDFDLGTLWESFGRKSFWRKYVISLDDYIGKTINIRFEYGVTHNYNNFDWLIDDVKVEVFDNVFGEGSDITEGSWEDPSMWRTGNSKAGGGLPTINDNVLINAKVMIPEGFVAQVNKIELNIDTVQVDRSGINKYGSLVIADGGQLKVNNPVGATMQKAIAGYGRGSSNWFLIAPPVVEALKPESDSIGGIIEGTYDLYSFDGSQQGEEWRNYKQHEQTFKLKNGLGYLVANSVNTSASFTGTVLPSNQAKEVGLAFAETTFGAWNLVGNPYTCQAYLSGDRPFYRLEETTDGSKIVLATDNVVAPMEGIFVQANNGDDVVIFTTTAPTENANALNFSLRKVEQGRGSISTPIDRARIRFGEGDNLGKLALMASPDRLYIPQNGTDYAVVFSQPVGELPLNFEAAEDGTYTLSFENATEGLVYCHLIDNLTGADVDLLTPVGFPLYKGGQGDSNAPRQAEYTFTAKKTDYASRFKVVFASDSEDANGDSETFAFNNNGNWIILNEGRATLQVIDLNGRILSSEQIEGSVQTSIHQPAGLYLIRLVNGDDVRVQKVVVR